MAIDNELVKSVTWLEHISYSSIRLYLEDQQKYYRWYILHDWDDFIQRPAVIIGKASHVWIEDIRNQVDISDEDWNNFVSADEETKKEYRDFIKSWIDIDAAIERAFIEIDDTIQTGRIEWWASGSEEKCKSETEKTLRWYLEELPRYRPIETECWWVFDLSEFGLLLPLKLFVDLVAYDENNDLVIVDHKTTTKWREKKPWQIYPDYDMQWWAYHMYVEQKFWKKAKKMIFDQVLKWTMRFPSTMRKADYIKLCEELDLWMSPWETIGSMKERLMAANAIKRLIPYEIDDIQRARDTFITIANQVITDVFFKLQNDLPFNPNFFSWENGQESYLDWLKDV